MESWEDAMNSLKEGLERRRDVTRIISELEGALRKFASIAEATENELTLLRNVDVELAKSSFDLNGVLRLIVEGALKLTKAQDGALLLPSNSGRLRIAWSSSGKAYIGRLIPIDRSITGEAYVTREVQRVEDVTDTSRLYFRVVDGMRSELAVPMIIENDQVLGVINLESTEPHRFSDHHVQLLRTLASQAAIALRNARIHAELTTLIKTQGDVLSENESLRTMLGKIGGQARELVGAEGCQILIKVNEELAVEYTTGSEALGTRVLVEDSVSGLAVKRREVVSIDDVTLDRAGFLYKGLLQNMRSELVVPLIAKGQVLGVINLESPRVGAFRGRDYLVRLFAHQAAVAILNTKRVEELLLVKQNSSQLWAMAQIGDVAANLVHRLNSEVGAVKVWVDEIRHRLPALVGGNEFLAGRLDDIYAAALRALELPRQLRTRIERAAQFGDIDVNALIEDVLETFDIPDRVELKTHLDSSISHISAPFQLDEVLRNLVQNALDAMEEEGGTLLIETRDWRVEFVQPGADKPLVGVEIIVSDDGPGMTEDRIGRLFEIGGTYKKRRAGSGFGLWWVKTFLDRVGGEIEPGRGEDRGMKFIVRMPLQARQPEFSFDSGRVP